MPVASLILILIAWTFAATPVVAQDHEIERMLRERDRQIKAILGPAGEPTAQQRDRLRDVVNDVIDFGAMARTAMGPFWQDLTEAQREAFTERFAAVIRAQSLADLELYRARVSYEGVDVRGAEARARTTVTLNRTPARVDYTLHRRDGQWKVTDIAVDGTSTAEGYARSFQRVLRRDGVVSGYDRLMQSLQRRLERGD